MSVDEIVASHHAELERVLAVQRARLADAATDLMVTKACIAWSLWAFFAWVIYEAHMDDIW